MEKKSNNTSRELEQWKYTSVERKIYHSVTEWTSLLIAIGTTCFSNLLDIVLAHSFKNHDSQLTILQLHFKTSVLSSPIIAAATPVLFTFCTWSFMISMNRDITTIVRGIPSCLLSKARFIWGKSYKIRHLPKPVGRVAKGAFPLIRCFKQFLSSLRIAFTFGKSLSTSFAAIVLWKDLFFIMYNLHLSNHHWSWFLSSKRTSKLSTVVEQRNPANNYSIVRWKKSYPEVIPKGIWRNLHLPNGLLKVVMGCCKVK